MGEKSKDAAPKCQRGLKNYAVAGHAQIHGCWVIIYTQLSNGWATHTSSGVTIESHTDPSLEALARW